MSARKVSAGVAVQRWGDRKIVLQNGKVDSESKNQLLGGEGPGMVVHELMHNLSNLHS